MAEPEFSHWGWRADFGLNSAPSEKEKGEEPNDEEHEEENLRDSGGGACNPAEAQEGCDQGDDEKYQGPV
jgi:hypothetical protein